MCHIETFVNLFIHAYFKDYSQKLLVFGPILEMNYVSNNTL